MTLDDTDLEAAVAEGVVTADQAAALRSLAERRARQQVLLTGHEERFQFMRSFNDFFFAIGVALLGGGLLFFSFAVPLHSLIAAIVVWALAELLVGRMRLVLPGILLVCLFVIFAVLASPIDFLFAPPTQRPPGFSAFQEWFVTHRAGVLYASGPLLVQYTRPLILLAYAGTGIAAALLFYIHFRLPFALLLIAGGLVAVALGAAAVAWPGRLDQITSPVLLVCGFAVFAAAMAFDASDRERLTRRADCAFWLHLLAAPLIVHSLIELAWPDSSRSDDLATHLSTHSAVVIALIFVAMAAIAVIIDRRALLVSGLTYFGTVVASAIARTMGQHGLDNTAILFITLGVLGILVLALGVGWQPMRRLLVGLLSPALANRLPPAVVAPRA